LRDYPWTHAGHNTFIRKSRRGGGWTCPCAVAGSAHGAVARR